MRTEAVSESHTCITTTPDQPTAVPQLPVSAVQNVTVIPASDSQGDNEIYYDARDQQPWLAAPGAGWSWHPLTRQIKNALHAQLHFMSSSAMAVSLLHAIPADLSKVLAAVLVCSSQGRDLLWQSGIIGGLEMIHRLMALMTGSATVPALLTSLPPLIFIWLARHHVSLTDTLINTLTLLLSSGIAICAAADFSQPAWLLQLDEQIITPVSQLLRDSGVLNIVTSGITLLLGCYVMLRLCGGRRAKIPPANGFNHGLRLISQLCQLCVTSQAYQRQYLTDEKVKQTRHWYEHTHHKSFQLVAASHALQRAVIRCLPQETLRQRETLSTSAFQQAYQQTERQILQQPATSCPGSQKPLLPPGQHRYAAAAAPAAHSPASAAQTTPLLVSTAVATGSLAVQSLTWRSRTAAISLAATAAGATFLAGARYLQTSLSGTSASALPEGEKLQSENNICLEMIQKIRTLLGSNNSGVTLSAELFNYLFDPYGDLRIQRANRYLTLLSIHSFNATARDEMNEQLRHTLSILWSRENNNKPVDVSQMIVNLQKHIFTLWAFLIKNKKNVIIKNVLKELRLYCAKEYLSLGMYSRLSMEKITNFLLSLAVPDLLLFESNGLENEKVISKKNYFAWNYIGRLFTENRHLKHDDFPVALRIGCEDGFVIARSRSYPNYNASVSRKELEETYQHLNEELYTYHKLDTELEAMPVPEFDSIIEIYYPGIKLTDKVNVKNYPFVIKTQGRMDKDIRILRECENFRDVIRFFKDGLSVLYEHAPAEIPEQWRIYDNDQKGFSLKPHLTRDELYEKFEIAYQQMVDKHCELYSSILDNAFKILPEEDLEIFQKDNIEIYSINLRAERFNTFRNMFMPVAFNLKPEFLERIAYKNRPYFETGKIFIVYHPPTNKKFYFAGHIEISRVKSRQFPVWRLPVNRTEDILNLDQEFLNTNYLFADEQSLFDPCDEPTQPTTTLFSRWNETGEFVKGYYGYYRGKICAATRHPQEIKITFREHRLGDQLTSPLTALKAEMTENRRKLLLSLKEKAFNPTKHEAKSEHRQLLEMMPLYNCYEFVSGVISQEDSAPPSILMQFFQATLCAADLYTGYGVGSLLKMLKRKYVSLWLKKHEFAALRRDIEKALKRTTPPGDRATLLRKMNDGRKQLDEIEEQINGLRNSIHQAMADLLSTPVFIAFPYLGLRSRSNFVASNLMPWGIGLVKTGIKKIVSGQRNRELKYIWHNPSAGKLIEYEHYYLPYPDASNASCYTDQAKKDNVILNIFELRHSDPEVYKQLHFTALNKPTPTEIALAAKENDYIIPEDHNQMAMFCFIALTIPARFYSSTLLRLEDYYKTGKNDIKITQQALYQYYNDAIKNPSIVPPVELKPEQHQLIEMSIHSLASLLQSTIQGIEINYIFMIHYFLLHEDITARLNAINSHPAQKEKIVENMQRDLTFNMERFTLYGSINSAIQHEFYRAVIEHYVYFCQQTVAANPRNTLLFSPSVDIFLQRQSAYQAETNDLRPPSPAEYVHHWQQTETLLLKIYESFARIEYSAKVFAQYPAGQWQNETVVTAWRQALDNFLFPEMRYENLLPLLRDAAQELSQIWHVRHTQAQNKPEILREGEVNPLFIEDVTRALKKCCPRYANLFFCIVYAIDNGRWFTPLNNDFISESQIRSVRQAHASYPGLPLPDVSAPPFKAGIISALQHSMAQWQPLSQINSTQLYHHYLIHVQQTFLHELSLPFHQRWQGYLPDAPPHALQPQHNGTLTLINALIDPKGRIIDYQLRILRHHLPHTAFPDHYPLLQLLSDLLQITHPAVPPLYSFVFHHLQTTLAQPSFAFASLYSSDFAGRQTDAIQRACCTTIQEVSPFFQQALHRYILATVRHLLSFVRDLPRNAQQDNASLAVRWLHLGAVIARQLRLPHPVAEDLLALSWAAQHDAGLLCLRETAIQQLAMLSGENPSAAQSAAQNAVSFILPGLQAAAALQQRIFHSVEASQLLSLLLHDLNDSAMTAEQAEQLRVLAASALAKQRDLLQLTLQQLSVDDKLRLSQWLQQGKLEAIWYQASSTTRLENKIIGFALAAENQQGVLLPVAEPLYMPLIFRALAPGITEEQLSQRCFGRTATSHTYRLLPAVRLNLESLLLAGTPPLSDPAEVLHAQMQKELTRQLNNLTHTDSNTLFVQLKLQLTEWLAQHLFFFDRNNQSHYPYIFGQAERMTRIAAQSETDGWRTANQSANAEDLVTPFSQAIRHVIGDSTILPELAHQLTDTTPLSGDTLLSSLNTNGFAGFWWDPFSRLCYLGWKKGNNRLLYASTPESRDTLYRLADENTLSEIWPIMARSAWVQDDLQALLQHTLSAAHFFADAVPTAWRLHCALAEALPLPAGAAAHSHLADVWFTTLAGVHHYFFSPAAADGALPVTLETLPGGSYRLTFTPDAGHIAPDLGFVLETRPFDSGPHRWLYQPADGWQLLAAPQAESLIRQGIVSPERFLQWGTEPGNGTSMTPADHVLQRSDGCMMFTFDDAHSPHTRYRLLDVTGTLQPGPTQPAGWSLLTQEEFQFVSRQLLTAQESRLKAITTASGLMMSLPFRYAADREAQVEWHSTLLHLRSAGRNLVNEVLQRAKITAPQLTTDELLWQRFDWRTTDVYPRAERDDTRKKLQQQQLFIKTMLAMIKEQRDLYHLTENLQRWLHQLLHHSQQASIAMELINAQPDNRFPASDATLHLQRQHFAQNYFFNYYHLQLYATADLFLQPWHCIADDDGFAHQRLSWQPALNLLHLLASALPAEARVLDRLLALPDVLWQAAEMQQHAQQWQQYCHSLLSDWRTPRRAENITLIRPDVTAQELACIPQREQWPVRLLLSAGKGTPVQNQTTGIAPAIPLSAEQQEDLLLLTPGPQQGPALAPRLAGISAHPLTARSIVAQAKLRLSSPWALAEFCGPAFIARLQRRMQQVIAGESDRWTQEERDFYQAADSHAFLLEQNTLLLDKPRYAAFFRQLWHSNLLVTRLIMSDVEMVFALLCERFIEQHPRRASEDISRAWFLFLHSAETGSAGGDPQSLYLVGV